MNLSSFEIKSVSSVNRIDGEGREVYEYDSFKDKKEEMNQETLINTINMTNKNRLNMYKSIPEHKKQSLRREVKEKDEVDELRNKNKFLKQYMDVLAVKLSRSKARIKKLKGENKDLKRIRKLESKRVGLIRKSLLCHLKWNKERLDRSRECADLRETVKELKSVGVARVSRREKSEKSIEGGNYFTRQQCKKEYAIDACVYKTRVNPSLKEPEVISEVIDEPVTSVFDIQLFIDIIKEKPLLSSSAQINKLKGFVSSYIEWSSRFGCGKDSTMSEVGFLVFQPNYDSYDLDTCRALKDVKADMSITHYVIKALILILHLKFQNNILSDDQLLYLLKTHTGEAFFQDKFNQIIQILLRKDIQACTKEELVTMLNDHKTSLKNFNLIHTMFNHLFHYIEYYILPTTSITQIDEEKLIRSRSTLSFVNSLKYMLFMKQEKQTYVDYYCDINDLLTAFSILFSFRETQAFSHKYLETFKGVIFGGKFSQTVQKEIVLRLVCLMNLNK